MEVSGKSRLGPHLVRIVFVAVVAALAAHIAQRLIVGKANPAVSGGIAAAVAVITVVTRRN